jgi:fructuronate reductase
MPAAIPLSRSTVGARPAAPVRIVHLGLGNFFRAHPAFYTARATDAPDWGIAAFTGRSPAVAVALAPQDGLYTLVTRSADQDGFEVMTALSAVHPAADLAALRTLMAAPATTVVTTTVTEAGYHLRPGGGLDLDDPAVQADLVALRGDRAAVVATAPARLLAGILGRSAAGAGRITVVPCDNLPGNGPAVRRAVVDLAAALDPALVDVVTATACFVSTVVDRITPRTTPTDRRTVSDATGFDDRAAVVCEPFHEWVLSGEFAAERPAWEAAGATIAADAEPFERRKLWLLNGAHSLLAYAGSAAGHVTVAEAIEDPVCRADVVRWWDEACRHLTLPASGLADYRAALLERWSNDRIRHELAQIAADGSIKVPVRILPVLRAERAAGRSGHGGATAIAAWIGHLRGAGAPVVDVAAARWIAAADGPLRTAVPAVLRALDPALASDDELVATITAAVPAGRD